MTNICYSDVLGWLNDHPEHVFDWLDNNQYHFEEYFIQRVELELVDKWLSARGLPSVQECVFSRRGSEGSIKSTPASSPIQKTQNCPCSEPNVDNHRRSNSKKHLRKDFARSKTKSVFLTASETTSTAVKLNGECSGRRSSLKGLRKYVSLPPSSRTMLSLLIESKVQLPQCHRIDRDSKTHRRQIDEREFFLDIVKDIANDLDLRSLTQKVTENLSLLLDADGASLFLVEGTADKQKLVSKIFDIHTGTNILPTTTPDDCIQVPWGKGFIGYVAETGNTVNMINPSEDERYNDEVDKITGYITNSLLCMPVRSSEEIIAVAQVVNKNPSVNMKFTKDDEKLLETYLQFCSIAITNAKLFEQSRIEYDRNRVKYRLIVIFILKAF
ncbi:PDE11A (predicted) [Pycnogonum litorale]